MDAKPEIGSSGWMWATELVSDDLTSELLAHEHFGRWPRLEKQWPMTRAAASGPTSPDNDRSRRSKWTLVAAPPVLVVTMFVAFRSLTERWVPAGIPAAVQPVLGRIQTWNLVGLLTCRFGAKGSNAATKLRQLWSMRPTGSGSQMNILAAQSSGPTWRGHA